MTTAQHLARRFETGHAPHPDQAESSSDFDAWLASFWRADCPREPDTCPDATSFLGGASGFGAVRWYELEDLVLGYLPGIQHACFAVPRCAIEPSLDEALDDDGPPCDGDDHDLLHAMPPPWLASGAATGAQRATS